LNINLAADLRSELSRIDGKFIEVSTRTSQVDPSQQIAQMFSALRVRVLEAYTVKARSQIDTSPRTCSAACLVSGPCSVSCSTLSSDVVAIGGLFPESLPVFPALSSADLPPEPESQIPIPSLFFQIPFIPVTSELTTNPFILQKSRDEQKAQSPESPIRQNLVHVPARSPEKQPRRQTQLQATTDLPIQEKDIAKRSKQKNKRENFPADVIRLLKQWLDDHFDDPYPSAEVKMDLATRTNLTYEQVQHWFVNARMRIWRPEIKKMTKPIRDKRGGRASSPSMNGSYHKRHQKKSFATEENEKVSPKWMRVPLALGGTKCQQLET